MQILIKLVEAVENPTTDALKDISIAIFDLDVIAKAERMRMLNLPDNAVIPVTDCGDCEIYTTIKEKLDTLKTFAEKDADGDDDSKDDSTDIVFSTGTDGAEDRPNCEWQEYLFSKSSVLPAVDQIIQTSIFKANKDSDKRDVIIGLEDLQGVFDDRIKKLFEEKLVCPEEVTAMKKSYMPHVNKCMEEFLRPSVRFTQMSRRQRISCILILRGAIESRSTKLLQFELERSLDGIYQQNKVF